MTDDGTNVRPEKVYAADRVYSRLDGNGAHARLAADGDRVLMFRRVIRLGHPARRTPSTTNDVWVAKHRRRWQRRLPQRWIAKIEVVSFERATAEREDDILCAESRPERKTREAAWKERVSWPTFAKRVVDAF